jgi:hypothetical protein
MSHRGKEDHGKKMRSYGKTKRDGEAWLSDKPRMWKCLTKKVDTLSYNTFMGVGNVYLNIPKLMALYGNILLFRYLIHLMV